MSNVFEGEARPARRKKTAYRGGLRHDGMWDGRANAEGEPLDHLTRMLDGLCASRRMTDRSPRDFALRIGSVYGHLVKEPAERSACVFNGETMAEWLRLKSFEDWHACPARTVAERLIRDKGLGRPPLPDPGSRVSPERAKQLKGQWAAACKAYIVNIPIENYRFWVVDPNKRLQDTEIRDGFVYPKEQPEPPMSQSLLEVIKQASETPDTQDEKDRLLGPARGLPGRPSSEDHPNAEG